MNLKAFRHAATFSFSVAMAGVMFAQGPPQGQPDTSRQAGQPKAGLHAMQGQTVTVTGCLAQEQTVAGQTPNVTERAGVAPDYVLTNVQMRSASPTGTTATPSAPGAPGATDAPGAAAGSPGVSVKLKQVDNDQMRANVNKRIEVTGRIQAADPSSTTGGTPTGAGERVAGAAGSAMRGGGANQPLTELHVSSVRVLNEACTPSKQ